MLWFVLALLIVLAAVAGLAVLVLGLWRRVKALTHVLTAAGDTIAAATGALEAAQASGPLAGPGPASRRPPGA